MGADRTVKLVINRELRWYELLGIMALSVAAIYALRHAEGNGTPPEGLGHLAAYTLTNVLSITWLAFMVVTLIHRWRTRREPPQPPDHDYLKVYGGPADGLSIPAVLVLSGTMTPTSIETSDRDLFMDCYPIKLTGEYHCYEYRALLRQLDHRGPCREHTHVTIEFAP
jgi:hypothetical protein